MNRSARRRPLIAAALLIAMLPAAGCSTGAVRDIGPVTAEQKSLDATRPYAAAYVEKYPGEKQEVDDFYSAWQRRLDQEKAAAPSTSP